MSQQTFSTRDRDHLYSQFAGGLDNETLSILYRASNSETFGADLRELIGEIVKPEALSA